MKRIVFLLSLILIIPAGFTIAQSDQELKVQLKREVLALDSAIISVRTSRAIEPSLSKFKIQWMPTVTIRRGTSLKSQRLIAKKLANYVVNFQGGVKIDGVHGGMLGFFEGNNWYPKIKQVAYKIVGRKPLKINVWAEFQALNEHGTATCCEGGVKIGSIKNNQFVAK